MTGYIWQIESAPNSKFPFRISIEEEGRTILALRAQDKWPGQKGNIFCIRERSAPEEEEDLRIIERVPIAFLRRQGKRVEIVLDRNIKKRCDFLFLKKKSKNGRQYEQIFFRTQTGLRSHRSKGGPLLYGTDTLELIIDSAEKYPWNFPDADVRRDRLPAGDYALVEENRFIALVERKTFDNMVTDLYQSRILHQKLSELSSFPNPAMVIEAQYGDFLDNNKIGEKCSPGYLSRLLGELSVLHPGVQIIYAGNRKLGNTWTARFFSGIRKNYIEQGYGSITAGEKPPAFVTTPVRRDLEVRKRIIEEYGQRKEGFQTKHIAADFPDMKKSTIQGIIKKLKKSGDIYAVGKGSGTRYYSKVSDKENR
ncbi:MAG: ERCC4 domain-containing protein [Spirochaetia bacterium]